MSLSKGGFGYKFWDVWTEAAIDFDFQHPVNFWKMKSHDFEECNFRSKRETELFHNPFYKIGASIQIKSNFQHRGFWAMASAERDTADKLL